jgi:adenylylsulfate kinase
LPASGKSTIAAQLADQLKLRGVMASVLESDVLRREFSGTGQYGEQEREYFYTALAFIGRVLTEQGVPVIFDATANRRSYRDRARRSIPNFVEVYVNTPLEVCIQRDPKGIYRAGAAGAFQNVPGLQAAYEPPDQPDLVVDGRNEKPESAASRIVGLLESRGLVV